jgi:hypothetical protein
MEQKKRTTVNVISKQPNALVLFDDDDLDFDYVVTCLIADCDHVEGQAIQCTYLTDKLGQCIIKVGTKIQLEKIQFLLSLKGLTTEIRWIN